MSVAARLRSAVWGRTSSRVRQTQALRQPAIDAYRGAARLVLTGPAPKVLANSVPKSGTHLLTQMLGEVPKLWYSGIHTVDTRFRADRDEPGDGLGEFDLPAFEKLLGRARNGQFVTGHIAHLPGVPAFLAQNGFAPLLMIRDPRDVVTSLAHFHASRPQLAGYHRLTAMSEKARIDASIDGLPHVEGDGRLPSIRERLERFEGWLGDPATVVIRFEDLIGVRGGGSDEAQHAAIRRVLQHCHRPADDAGVAAIARSVFSEHATTFRRGAIGDWRNHFTDDQTARFDETTAGALGRFGYS